MYHWLQVKGFEETRNFYLIGFAKHPNFCYFIFIFKNNQRKTQQNGENFELEYFVISNVIAWIIDG